MAFDSRRNPWRAGPEYNNGTFPPHTTMKLLFDFFPLLIFFTAFKLADIYIATGAAIVATFVQIGIFWYRYRRFETMHLVTLAIISVFGGLTIAFHDDTFIKWKPTIINWLFGVIVIGSHFIGKKSAIERLMGAQLSLPSRVWSKVNASWGIFFLLMGLLNLYVAFFYNPEASEEVRQATWVNFKVFGMLGLTLLFSLGQMLFLARYIEPEEQKQE